jgi:prepilin-type N-terminal cleavage/methylation domain-containing protein
MFLQMNKHKGFTLIEVIMVITLLGTLAAVIALPLIQGVRGWFAVSTRAGIADSGRVALERMVREIKNIETKEVAIEPTEPPSPCIASTADATTLPFSGADGDLANCNTTTFSLSGSQILRNGTPLANNIQSLAFGYYNAANTPLTPPLTPPTIATIRRISIEIVAEKGGEVRRDYSEVSLPNMRSY